MREIIVLRQQQNVNVRDLMFSLCYNMKPLPVFYGMFNIRNKKHVIWNIDIDVIQQTIGSHTKDMSLSRPEKSSFRSFHFAYLSYLFSIFIKCPALKIFML